ncbi:MAG: XDD4 family exosortase-dependent surface protein [Planctomycetaceae bacterium]|nr:PEP-CTERM sorting domain-containing protein [Planctomycetaceae bacterium]
MKNFAILVTCGLMGLMVSSADASVMLTASGYSATGDEVAFTAEVSISGDILTVQLSNNSPVASNSRDDVLSSFYFDILNSAGLRPSLNYVSATGDVWMTSRNSADVLQTADANLLADSSGDNTWQYKTMNAALMPFYGFGIGTVGNSGLGVNGFSGNVVDGVDYSIYTGEVLTQSLNGLLLVRGGATFTFSGATGFSDSDIKTSAIFGLGTGPDSLITGGGTNNIPEPATAAMLVLGGVVALARQRRMTV